MVICADTSFLFALYASDVHTPRALAWSRTSTAPITVSALTEYELGNALRFAEFRKLLAPGQSAVFWAQYEADRAGGRILLEVCNLARVVAGAKRLSATHTLAGGHRAFDILHVAAALEMRATEFLTFDGRQSDLAEAEGLSVAV
jgi:predicted nucleic acid-binding protein